MNTEWFKQNTDYFDMCTSPTIQNIQGGFQGRRPSDLPYVNVTVSYVFKFLVIIRIRIKSQIID